MTSKNDGQRTIAQQLIVRAREDRAFAQRLREDPETVLAEAQLPKGGRDDLLREAPGGDPTSSAICVYTCEWTCIWTS